MNKWKWLMVAAVLAAAVSGCGAAANNGEHSGHEGNGGTEQPQAETPTEKPAEEPATEQPAEEPKTLGVETGAAVEIETMIEGLSEKVNVTEYTLTPALFQDGYEAAEPIDVPADAYPYAGKLQGFQKDGYFHGYHVFDVNGNALVIYHSYPYDAGDGMGAVMHEFMKSLKG
jgi:hypothetical protein